MNDLTGSDLELLPPEVREVTVRHRLNLVAQYLSDLQTKRGRSGQLVVVETTFAIPWVYCGEWIAECPQRDCTNAEYMTEKRFEDRHKVGFGAVSGIKKDAFYCSHCKCLATSVHWPKHDQDCVAPAGVDHADEIMELLNLRSMPETRNWFYTGQKIAVARSAPDGQTLAELRAENDQHEVG